MKRRESLTPDLTPIIDVVFLILIFFLVSSTFKKDEKAFDLILPQTGHAKTMIKKQEIAIELTVDNIALRGEKMSFKALDEKLSDVKDHDKPINVRIDQEVAYKRVMQLFDLLKKHDLNNLALESEVVEN